MLIIGCSLGANAQYQVTFLDDTANGGQGYGVSGGQQVGVGFTAAGDHAMLWYGSKASQVDLHPAGSVSSYAYGVGGGKQVGYSLISGNPKAILWSGSAASAVNLSPPGTTASYAFATDGVQQVGSARSLSTQLRAVLWSGTAASAVSLHPLGGYVTSSAEDLDGGYQVGYAAGSGHIYAGVWHGTSASFVSIDPAGATYSRARALSGTQVVGEAADFGATGTHAVLWSNFTAASATNLKPAWLDGSDYAYDTNGTSQVGWGVDGLGIHHAILWQGTAASAFDLNTTLPAGATGAEAWSIDEDGNIMGTTYFGTVQRATLWRPICTVTGQVTFGDFEGDRRLHALVFEIRDPGTTIPLETHTVYGDASGNYAFQVSLRGTYDIALKATHWLRTVANSVDTRGATVNLDLAIINGDVDGDNEIAIGDYAQLSTAFGTDPNSPNWNAMADLNGDDEVTIGDYAILSNNFGMIGD